VVKDIANGSGRPLLKYLGIVVVLSAVVLNAWLFADARSFELGETMSPVCGEFRRLGLIEPVTLLLIIQIAVFVPLILLRRNWLWLGLAVVPYWLALYVSVCMRPNL
jgi:hypothetical protein